MTITILMKRLAKARQALEAFGVRDTGDYAEVLVAAALEAKRNQNGVQKGYDILCARYGKVEVRSRTLPRDGRWETRLEVPEAKIGAFDYLAGLLFAADLRIMGGFLLSHDDAVALARQHLYLRIPFERGSEHPRALDITALLKQAQKVV